MLLWGLGAGLSSEELESNASGAEGSPVMAIPGARDSHRWKRANWTQQVHGDHDNDNDEDEKCQLKSAYETMNQEALDIVQHVLSGPKVRQDRT